MLIRPGDESALAIGQLSHSWLAGQLARAWGNERFGGVAPREEIVLGAEQHDIGWALFDLEPRFNPDTGLPRSFLELTVDDHLAIWRDAPDPRRSAGPSTCRWATTTCWTRGRLPPRGSRCVARPAAWPRATTTSPRCSRALPRRRWRRCGSCFPALELSQGGVGPQV